MTLGKCTKKQIEQVKEDINKEYSSKPKGVEFYKGVPLKRFTKEELIKLISLNLCWKGKGND